MLASSKEVHMLTDLNNYRRRQDYEMAKVVQCGLSMLYLAGVAEACQYLARAGISGHIIERVVSARDVRGAEIRVYVEINRSA
jgi:hypothetical protein